MSNPDYHARAIKAWQTRARNGDRAETVQQRGDYAARLIDPEALHTDDKGRQWEVKQGNPKFAAVKGKVAVRRVGTDSWSNWHDNVRDAVAEQDKMATEREHERRADAVHRGITDRILTDPGSPTDADVRTLTGGYPSFNTASAKRWLAMAGFRGKDADRVLNSNRVGSLGQSRGGANLFDARSVIEEAVRQRRAR